MMDLESAVAAVGKIYAQGRTAPLSPETAVKAMNYSGLNGAALTTLASLTQYGLVDRPSGKVVVTSLAVKILFPKSEEQRMASLREAALKPRAFSETIRGYERCGIDVISAHLIQEGYVEERARKVAAIYTANKLFAKLDIANGDEQIGETTGEMETDFEIPPTINQKPSPSVATQPRKAILAQYTIPLGANEATLVFTGERLAADDFDALVDFVEFSKKQFLRAQKNTQTEQERAPSLDGF